MKKIRRLNQEVHLGGEHCGADEFYPVVQLKLCACMGVQPFGVSGPH